MVTDVVEGDGAGIVVQEDPNAARRHLRLEGSLGAGASLPPPRWLLYPNPFFEDTPCILEPGEYPNSEAWGASDPSVGSLKPMRLVRSRWSQVSLSYSLREEAGLGSSY